MVRHIVSKSLGISAFIAFSFVICNCQTLIYSPASYIDSEFNETIKKFTAIWIPSNLNKQCTLDNVLSSKFHNNYIPFYSLYKPTEDLSPRLLMDTLNKQEVDSIMLVYSDLFAEDIPKNTHTLLQKLVDYNIDYVGFSTSYKVHFYSVSKDKVICVMQFDKLFPDSEDTVDEVGNAISAEVLTKNLIDTNKQILLKKTE